MDDNRYSKHSLARLKQRSLSDEVVSLLLSYGEYRKCRGNAESFYFSRESLRQILNDHGRECLKACEKLRNAYAVVAKDGTIITVARSYRTVH